MSPGRALLLAFIAAAHVGGLWWMVQERSEPMWPEARSAPDLPPRPVPPPRSAPRVPDAPEPPPPTPIPQQTQTNAPELDAAALRDPLPPHDAPLAQVMETLEARAAAGDRRASCRLATDGLLCEQQPGLRRLLASSEQAAAQQARTPDASGAAIALLEPQLERAQRICDGLPAAWIENRLWRHALDAAQTYPQLATRVAQNPQLSMRLSETPVQPGVPHDTAASLLQRAAHAGDPHAIQQLHRIHSGEARQHAGIAITLDPRLALVYALVLQRLVGEEHAATLQAQIDAGRATMTSAQWEAVEAEAQALFDEAFAGRAPVEFDPDALAPLTPQICELP